MCLFMIRIEMIAAIVTAPATAPSTMPAKAPLLIPEFEDPLFTATKKKDKRKRKGIINQPN